MQEVIIRIRLKSLISMMLWHFVFLNSKNYIIELVKLISQSDTVEKNGIYLHIGKMVRIKAAL